MQGAKQPEPARRQRSLSHFRPRQARFSVVKGRSSPRAVTTGPLESLSCDQVEETGVTRRSKVAFAGHEWMKRLSPGSTKRALPSNWTFVTEHSHKRPEGAPFTTGWR